MAQSTLRPHHLKDEIRMVLVGKTGTGKSATGNSILGKDKFESNPSSESVTEYCEHESTFRFGKQLQVVDAPGFVDTQLSKEERYKRIAQCVVLLSPGIHAILFVIEIGRFTEEDVKTVEAFIELFGPESRRHVIIVFTRADDLTESYDLQKFITKSKGLKPYLEGFNNRYIAVNNKASSEEREAFTKGLLDKIEVMQKENKESFYTSEMFKEAEEQVKKVEAENLKEIEEKNREKNEKIKQEALAEYKAEVDELKVDNEKKNALIEKKDAELQQMISLKNAYEARWASRYFLSLAIKGMGAGAYLGANVGGFIGKELNRPGAELVCKNLVGVAGGVVCGVAGAVIGLVADFASFIAKSN